LSEKTETKTLLELLKNRPRWTRFQNFDLETSVDELEKCFEEIEVSVEGLVEEIQDQRDKYQKISDMSKSDSMMALSDVIKLFDWVLAKLDQDHTVTEATKSHKDHATSLCYITYSP